MIHSQTPARGALSVRFLLAVFLGFGLIASPLQAQVTDTTTTPKIDAPADTTIPTDELRSDASDLADGEAAEADDLYTDNFDGDMDTAQSEAEGIPADLSPWGMFLAADIVVKAVMIGLVIASVVTWTIWFAKRAEISRAKNRARAAFNSLAAAQTLDQVAERLGKTKGPVHTLAEAAIREVQVSGDAPEKEGVKERIALRFQRIEANAARDIGTGIGILATIGATAPFVGLFGTVWGIMNSFIGIAHTQTTSLAVVAPGIAEALLATGLGLVAAIPAVVIYNSFTRSIGGYRTIVGDSSAELLRIVSRDLDRGNRTRTINAAG